jgi:hypothetical protein
MQRQHPSPPWAISGRAALRRSGTVAGPAASAAIAALATLAALVAIVLPTGPGSTARAQETRSGAVQLAAAPLTAPHRAEARPPARFAASPTDAPTPQPLAPSSDQAVPHHGAQSSAHPSPQPSAQRSIQSPAQSSAQPPAQSSAQPSSPATPPATQPRGERFDNATAGISLVRPAGWSTASLQQVEENRARVRLSDAELQDAIQKRASAPLFVFTKYPEPYDDLNPSIQVGLRPLGALASLPATKLLEGAMAPLQHAYADFQTVTPIEETVVCGLKAAHAKFKYTLSTGDSLQFRTLTRMWIVPRGSFVFLIGMSGPERGPDVSEKEFATALESMKIEK